MRPCSFVPLALSALALALPGARAATPSPAPLGPPVVTRAVRSDLSPPLRDMKRIPPPWSPRQEGDREIENRLLPKAEASRTEKRAGDTAVQSWRGEGTMPAPVKNWEGVDNQSGVLPPDTNGDVGMTHYVQWVNLTLAMWDKSGTLVYGPVDGNTIWQGFGGPADNCNSGDPIVIYDRMAGRWIVSQFALCTQPFYQYVAVSQTEDPTGAWYRYAFEVGATIWGDYPKLGAWPDGYYMSVNQFTDSGRWAGAGVFAFEKAKMLTGDPSARSIYFNLGDVNSGYGGILPGHVIGPNPPPSGTPCPFAEVDDNAWGWPADQFSLWEFHANWSNPAASTFGQGGLPNQVLVTAPFDSNLCNYNSCIPQPDTSVRLDTLCDRLMFRLQYLNSGDHQTLLTCHTVDATGSNQAGIRWYEIRNGGSGWNIYQQGTFAPDTQNRWMGSVAMDKSGDIALGYSVSSGDTYPSIRYAGRLPGDPLGELSQSEQSIIAGGGSQLHPAARWGDYSAMTLDPADDCTFWYTQEYYTLTTREDWKTRIASFRFPSCGAAPIAATASASPASGLAPLDVSFTGTATGGTPPYTYAWDFGDGASATGQNPTHTYASQGSYTATATVSDSVGQTIAATATVTVCTLTLSASASPSTGLAPLSVAFSASASVTGGCGATPALDWDFGDGSAHSSQATVTHSYSAAGTFTWTLTASVGGTTRAQTGTVVVCGLTCDATVVLKGQTGTPVVFAGQGALSGGCTDPVSFAWTFGDSATAAGANASHTYTAAGTFTWNLAVAAGPASCAKSGSITIVTPPAVSKMTKSSSPFKLVVTGANLQPGVQVLINGAAWPSVSYKGATKLQITGGATLKAAVPKGQTTHFTFANPDGGQCSFDYTY